MIMGETINIEREKTYTHIIHISITTQIEVQQSSYRLIMYVLAYYVHT